jgi:hypothetical protein
MFTLATRAEQFSKYANIFFLFTACIQQIPNVSPTNRYTTILPLGIVLIVAALKEAKEDIVRLFTLPILPPSPFPHLLRYETTADASYHYRNATNPIQTSTPVAVPSSPPPPPPSKTNPGVRSRLEISFGLRVTIIFRRIL